MDSAADLAKLLAVLQTFFAGLLVLLTSFYVFTTRRQLRAMEDALAETSRSNQATENSNKIAELGRRAWLVPLTAALDFTPHTGMRSPRAKITIKNAGGVPATNIEVFVHAAIVEELPSSPSPVPSTMNLTVVGAGESHEEVQELPRVSPADRELMTKGKCFLFFYYELRYIDVFGQPRESASAWRDKLGVGLVSLPQYQRLT